MKAWDICTNTVMAVLIGGFVVLVLGLYAVIRMALIPVFFGYCVVAFWIMTRKLKKMAEREAK